MEEVAQRGLQIYDNILSEDAEESIMDIMLQGTVEAFYIGGTTDPVRRWLGDGHLMLSKRKPQAIQTSCERSGMPGHYLSWDSMHLIAVARNEIGSKEARVLETDLIRFSKTKWPSLCENIAIDSRGQCDGTNFMYILVRHGL